MQWFQNAPAYFALVVSYMCKVFMKLTCLCNQPQVLKGLEKIDGEADSLDITFVKVPAYNNFFSGVTDTPVCQAKLDRLSLQTGNTKRGSITVLLTSCLTGLD
jgi:hypothetical protein